MKNTKAGRFYTRFFLGFPPGEFGCEFRTLLLPSPCKIRLYDIDSLFSGKIHAVLCRGWSRVKGRDLYDYLFYLARGARINIPHLKAKLSDSGFISSNNELTIPIIAEFLRKRFLEINYKQAEDDVRPFIRNPEVLKAWDADFFISATQQYLVEKTCSESCRSESSENEHERSIRQRHSP